jgi:tRNA (guanine37-N1)-methyltransferase
MMLPCLKTKKKDAESERRKLVSKGILNLGYSPKTDKDNVYFPLTKEIPGSIKSEFEVTQRKKMTLEDTLQEEGISPSLIAKSFDIFGDIALVEINGKVSKADEKKIAKAVMKMHPSIKVVTKKTGPISGEYRVRKLKVIGGENRTDTMHKEEGCIFHLDIANSYYSPRLVYERRRISALVKDNEDVFVPFAGVGPFAIAIAKNHPKARVLANELNPDAYKYMLENIKINKVTNVIPIEGDAKRILVRIPGAGIGIKASIRRKELKSRLSKPVGLVELFLKDGDIESRMDEVDGIIEILEKKNIRVMLHEPFYKYKGKPLLATRDERTVADALECYKKLYKICRRHANVVGFVAHSATIPKTEFEPEVFFRNFSKLSGFFDYLYLENNVSTIAEIKDIINTIKRSGVRNFCVDLSHLFIIYKDTRKIIETIKAVKRLCNTYFHIGDSDGIKDSVDIGAGKVDFKMIADSGLVDFGTIEVKSEDEMKGDEMLASYDKFISMLPQKKFDRIIMPLPMSSEKFLDMAFSAIKPGGMVHIYKFEKSEGNAVDMIKRYADKVKKKIKIISTRIARDYSSNVIEVVVDFQVL